MAKNDAIICFMITQQDLKSRISYNPETGVFRWIKPQNKIGYPVAGTIAGHVDKKGYRTTRIFGQLYLAHRLAWLYVHGKFPDGGLDHRNGVPGDNRIENLREADQVKNCWNAKRGKANTSGYKGVCPKRNKWRAYIQKDGRQINLGVFDTPEQAFEVRRKAADEFHGEFVRHD